MDIKIVEMKKKELIRRLEEWGDLLVAFSGGVDSTLLLVLAHQTLGKKAVAATANSIIHPFRETEYARNLALERGIRHIIFQADEMSLPDFVSNDADRCYHCKRLLAKNLFKIADDNGIRHVAHGANIDDLKDYRPGLRAAEEADIAAPLIDAQLGKDEIRFLSKEIGLPTWDKPSMPCIASRIPYGVPITEEKLIMIEKAETFLLKQGFKEVRVRHLKTMAGIEVDTAEFSNIMNERTRLAIVEEFRKIGFEHVALDLEGHISGKMNRDLGEKIHN